MGLGTLDLPATGTVTETQIRVACCKALALPESATLEDIAAATRHRVGLPMAASAAELNAAIAARKKATAERKVTTARKAPPVPLSSGWFRDAVAAVQAAAEKDDRPALALVRPGNLRSGGRAVG